MPQKKRLGLILYAETDPATIDAEHRKAMRALKLAEKAPSPSPVRAGDRLRVGFVSSDFADHPVAGNLRAFFEHRERDDWHLAVYANVESPDGVTDWYRRNVEVWRDISCLSPDVVETLMRSDDLDVLVFLAGRFNANWFFVDKRLAPVQVSFHDGATSVGPEIDYWVTDPVLHPPDSRERFTEGLARLPVFYSFQPPSADLPSEIAPSGPPTFGVFNNPAKITAAMVALWGRILTAMPTAQVRLKYASSMLDPATRRRLLDLFATAGVGAERLTFDAPSATRAEHMAVLGRVDVTLDTFPFTGATTTFESIWMGTPVVTLAGETFIQRAAASILCASGMAEYIASNPADYVRIAIETARAARRRPPDARRVLRERVKDSALCDGPTYARSLGGLLKKLAAG